MNSAHFSPKWPWQRRCSTGWPEFSSICRKPKTRTAAFGWERADWMPIVRLSVRHRRLISYWLFCCCCCCRFCLPLFYIKSDAITQIWSSLTLADSHMISMNHCTPKQQFNICCRFSALLNEKMRSKTNGPTRPNGMQTMRWEIMGFCGNLSLRQRPHGPFLMMLNKQTLLPLVCSTFNYNLSFDQMFLVVWVMDPKHTFISFVFITIYL